MRALAKKMLNGRARSDILESAYHRYAFHDKDARPRWFAEDEERHHRCLLLLLSAQSFRAYCNAIGWSCSALCRRKASTACRCLPDAARARHLANADKCMCMRASLV